MKRPLLLPALALVLAACQRQAPAEPPAPAPAAEAPRPGIVSDFSQPMTARGNEPFWALVMDGTTFTLKRAGEPDVVFTTPGAAISPGRATWVARSADGRQLTATLYVSECADSMSGLPHPMTAEVVLLNETLRGCAAKTAELPREGG